MEILTLLFLFVLSFFIRIFSVMMGGGALILLPILIFLGIPPSVAVASNRFGAMFINFTLIKFHKKKKVDWKLAWYLIPPTLIGALIGTYFVIEIDQEFYKRIIGLVTAFSVVLLLIKPKVGLIKFKITKTKRIIGWFLAILAGFLAGLFALTGIWLTYLFLYFGLDFIETAGTRKVLGICLWGASIIWLMIAGLVNWPVAIALFCGSGLGAWVGVDLGMKAGNVWIKKLFMVVVILSALKLLI